MSFIHLFTCLSPTVVQAYHTYGPDVFMSRMLSLFTHCMLTEEQGRPYNDSALPFDYPRTCHLALTLRTSKNALSGAFACAASENRSQVAPYGRARDLGSLPQKGPSASPFDSPWLAI